MADHPTAPRIKLTGLHVAGYRSLRRVDWPEDGLGWGGEVPDTVLVGGLNGSGKTTLLELIFASVGLFIAPQMRPALMDLVASLKPGTDSFVEGDFVLGAATCALELRRERPSAFRIGIDELRFVVDLRLHQAVPNLSRFLADQDEFTAQWQNRNDPRLLYFPTDRAVLFPATDFKGPGRHKHAEGPVYRYSPPDEWLRSIEALLYDARWRDLHAMSQGKPIPGHFAAFERVMQRFFAGSKQLYWDDDGELHVKTKDGALHGLDALSSGEKQVLLFGAELVERWTPGSLVLIDEPELHLHEAWLAALWDLISELQRERGGQVIVATQSNYLFGLGGHGTRVLLGGWRP